MLYFVIFNLGIIFNFCFVESCVYMLYFVFFFVVVMWVIFCFCLRFWEIEGIWVFYLWVFGIIVEYDGGRLWVSSCIIYCFKFKWDCLEI